MHRCMYAKCHQSLLLLPIGKVVQLICSEMRMWDSPVPVVRGDIGNPCGRAALLLLWQWLCMCIVQCARNGGAHLYDIWKYFVVGGVIWGVGSLSRRAFVVEPARAPVHVVPVETACNQLRSESR